MSYSTTVITVKTFYCQHIHIMTPLRNTTGGVCFDNASPENQYILFCLLHGTYYFNVHLKSTQANAKCICLLCMYLQILALFTLHLPQASFFAMSGPLKFNNMCCFLLMSKNYYCEWGMRPKYDSVKSVCELCFLVGVGQVVCRVSVVFFCSLLYCFGY